MQILAFLVAGIASWFQPPPEYDGMRVCAMNVVPAGTRVIVVNDDNGRESECTVIGTGPFVVGRVFDGNPQVAQDLGYYEAGTAHVRVYRVIGFMPPCKLVPQAQRCVNPPPKPCILGLPKPAVLNCK